MNDGQRTSEQLERENEELCRRIVALESGEGRSSEALHEGDARYRSLFDNMLEGLAHCRMLFDGGMPVDFVYLDVNHAFETLTGLTGVAGKKVSEVIPGIRESAPRLFEICGRVASTGKPERFEIYIEALRTWFDLSVHSPTKEHFVAVFNVITERKRMEQELVLFRALIDQSNDTFEVLDPDTGRMLDVNENGCRELGYSREEYLSLSVFDIDPMVDPLTFEKAAGALRASGFLTWEGVHRRKDGSTFPVEVGLKHVRLDRDYMVAVVRNVTERKRAEAEHLQFKLGITRSSDAIFLTARDGTITYVNPAFEALYGFSAVEAIGKTPRILKSGVLTPEACALFWNMLLAKQVVQGELVNKAKDGRLVHVEATANPILDAEGATIGFLAIQRDITARKQAAEQHEKLEAQLRHTSKMEAVGQLAGGVAHDFNNLLSVVLSYTGLLLEDLKPGDPVRADVWEINRAGERARDLTGQLLAFSRKQILEPRPSDLNQIVAGMEKMLRRLLGEDIELSLPVAHKLGTVYADPGQIEQVIMNLVVNARDAAPHGGSVSIETENVELDAAYAAEHPGVVPGSYVMIAVTDTGSGMDKATQARIFEPFFTTKELGKGTGLGLSMVFGIVHQSAGHIEVHSEPGVWTTFRVYLPRRDGPAHTASSTPPSPADLRGSETILLVEDDEQVRTVARAILRRHGYNVLEAQNGGEAFLICETFASEIHLLLTDVVMPRMSGREVVDRLAPMRPEMKVLYMSGYTEQSIVHRGILVAGIAFLRKPFTPDALARKVREVLSSSPSESVAPAP